MSFDVTATVKHVVPFSAGASFTTLSNVTSISMDIFMDSVVDPVVKATGRVSGRKPGLLPTISVGDGIRIEYGGAGGDIKDFFVADFRVDYDTVTNGDVWTIQLEDLAARLGRAIKTISWTAGTKAYLQWKTIIGAYASVIEPTEPPVSKTMSAQSLTNANVLTVITNILNTTGFQQGLFSWDNLTGQYTPNVSWARNSYIYENGVFNDGSVAPVTSGEFRYNGISYSSLANQYWTKVLCEADGLTAQSAGTGDRVYTFSTYNETTTDAKDNAAYVLAKLGVATAQPIRLGFQVRGQSGLNVLSVNEVPTIYFRGQTVYATIIGIHYEMTPQNIYVDYTLAPYGATNFFRLDDTILGRLDYNRLGF